MYNILNKKAMNTLRIFTPGVFKSLSDNAFDHFLFNREYEHDFNAHFNGSPHTNIAEESDKFRIELALPGYSKEQINMKYHENILTVNANVENNAPDGVKFLSREFGIKNFSKRFTIPRTLDPESINAEFTNGILSITVEKKEEAKEKEPIEVQIN
jgi:HSP20 family protein